MLTQIYNGKVLIPGGRWVNNGSVLIKDSEIVEVYGHSRIVEGVDRSFNAGGGYILPGGIDIHVHGGGGHRRSVCDGCGSSQTPRHHEHVPHIVVVAL